MAKEIKRPNYINCEGIPLPAAFSSDAFRSVLDYKPKPGELYIVTYPKCGTTWMQCIVMLIIQKGKPMDNAMDYMKNTPYIEFAGIDALNFMTKAGCIKSHLPFHLIPFASCAKYIYVTRNPKDCCVSFYHHEKKIPFYNFGDGTFDEYFELFVNGQNTYGDYFDHNLSWYEHKDEPNIYFVTYEDLKNDTRGEVLKIAKFMGEDYYETLKNNPDILDKVLEYSSIDYMKKTVNKWIEDSFIQNVESLENIPSGIISFKEYMAKHPEFSIKTKGDFIRKGIVGDWKNHFSEEQEKRMEERIREKTKGSDFMNLWKK